MTSGVKYIIGFLSQTGQSGYVCGPNEVEMLHNIFDVLVEIRELLKAKP